MEAWNRFLKLQEAEIGKDTTEKWLNSLKIVHFDAGNLYLEASDPLQILWFEEHIRPKARTLLVNNNNRPIKIHLSSSQEGFRHVKKKRPFQNDGQPIISFDDDPLDPIATFDNFIFHEKVLIPAKFLQETAESYLKNPTTSSPLPFNPIYLHGPEGCGKTHLLMAFSHSLKQAGKRVLFISAESFTQHVVQAIRTGSMDRFRKVYRTVDALIIDDIHILSKRNATQEELFHTFNALFSIGKFMLFSSDAAPRILSEIEERLVSRFEWGVCFSMDKIPLEALPSFLRKRSEQLNFSLSDEVLAWLSTNVPPHPNTLQKALQLLMLRYNGSPMPLPLVQKSLSSFLQDETQHALSPIKIVKAVAEHFGIKTEDILGKAQTQECAFARQTAMWICRKDLNLSLNAIGKFFNRDHSTVLSSLKQVQKRLDAKDQEILSALAEAPRLYILN